MISAWLIVPISSLAQTSSEDLIVYLEWVNDPTSTIVINWIEDDTSGVAEVLYRIRGSSADWTSTVGSVSTIPDTYLKKNMVQLTGLSPNSNYEFKIDSFTEIHNFRTLPADLTNSVRFLVTGDVYGDGSDPVLDTNLFTQISEHASAQNPYFVVLSGDIIHLDLANEYNQNTLNRYFKFLKEWTEYMITPQGNRIPMVVGLGNHELPQRFGGSPPDAKYFNALFSFPGLQGYNTLDFGDYLSLILLNTDHTARIEGAQTSWLDQQLNQKSNVKHVFPIYHVSAYPSSVDPLPGRGLEVLNYWTPIFEKYNVKFAFEHDRHGYKRTVPLKAGELNSCGVRYFGEGGFAIPGAGGDGNKWYVQNFFDVSHFLRVDISPSKRSVSAFSIYGVEIDGFSQTTIFEPPLVLAASSIQSNSFTANWDGVCEADKYYLDVSEDANFSTYVSGYESKNIGNLTSNNVTGLNPMSVYYYRVRAQKSNGEITGFSNSRKVTTSSLPPSAKPATSITSTGFNANWDPVVGANQYILEVSTSLNFSSHIAGYESRNVGNVTTFNVSNLLSSMPYYYRVSARNSELDLTSGASTIIGLITKPEIPQSISVSEVKSTSVQLTWTSVPRVNQYILDVATDDDFNNIVNSYENYVVANSTSVVITNLQPNSIYYYRVRASNSTYNVISEFSNTTSFQTSSLPPEVLIPTVISSQNFIALWNPVPGIDKYYIDVALDDNFTNIIPEYDNYDNGSETILDISNLNSATLYYYRVRAFNTESGLVSESSPSIQVFTLPEIPTIQPAEEIQPRSFIAKWNEVPRVDVYILDVSTDSMFTEIQLQFEVEGASFLKINELNPNTRYHYRVRAKNTEHSSIGLFSEVESLITTLDAPSDFMISNLETSSFYVSWDAIENVEFYTIDISLNSEFTEIIPEFNNYQTTDNYLQVDNLQSVQKYFIRVRANGSDNQAVSDYSQTVQVITVPEVPILQPPKNIRAVGFTATWLPVERVTHYVIDIANDENFTSIYENFENYNVGDVDEFQIEDVLPDTRLYFRIRAVNSILNVTSDNSVIQDVNTIAIDPEVSTFVADQTTILADGTQESILTATIRANDGAPLDGVTVDITAASGTSEIETVQAISDLNGVSIFKVRNNRAEYVEYNARAINVDLDQEIEIRFVPVSPTVQSGTNIVASSFQANWESVNGAVSYRLDVSEDENFATFLNGYEDLNVDDALLYTINGLYPGNVYYYRVRAIAPTGTSENSQVVMVITPEADPNLSDVDIQEPLILADNMSTGLIELTIRGENGEFMEGVPVRLETTDTNVVISSDVELTDQDGRVSFVVKSYYAGKVEFVVFAGRVSLATKAIVDFVPVPPVAVFPELLGAIEFVAKWEFVNGATHYLLDVSHDENFEQLLDGYENLNVGDESEYKIVGLNSGSTYYYRVRAATETTIGEPSNTIEVTTYRIDVENSSVEPSMKKILANGDQHSEVTIVLISDSGNPLSNVLVTLVPANPDHIVTIISDITDDQGTATFEIRSSTAGEGTFQVFAGGLELDTKVNIIFLFADGEIKLGNNYPNPFSNATKIPVTIPERMNVELFVYNTNGLIVDKLEDREFVAGYYEIEFSPRGLSSGVYFVRMIADGKVLIEKMMLIK